MNNHAALAIIHRVARAKTLIPLMALAAVFSGCWPFHHHRETPQQDYVEALRHGNSAQASEIWLKMSPEDRLMLQRGEGLHGPGVSASLDAQMRPAEQGSAAASEEKREGASQVQGKFNAADSAPSHSEPSTSSLSAQMR